MENQWNIHYKVGMRKNAIYPSFLREVRSTYAAAPFWSLPSTRPQGWVDWVATREQKIRRRPTIQVVGDMIGGVELEGS